MKNLLLFSTIILLLVVGCEKSGNEVKSKLFEKENLLAWCIVPFDSVKRTPVERAAMLKKLGIKRYAYDWRKENLDNFAEEIRVMRENNIAIEAVWFWARGDGENIISEENERILEILEEENLRTTLWVSFPDETYDGLPAEEVLTQAIINVDYIYKRAKNIGCDIALYNHGGWFGEPVNQIRIIRNIGYQDISMVYNFHHAHHQIDDFPSLLDKMIPYLSVVNINGMNHDGPKILPVGQGSEEKEMLKTLAESRYQGPIGILGHVDEADVEEILAENLKGLEKISSEL